MAYNKKTRMYEGYIYKVTNLINNKIYIGQTCTTIGIRKSGHYRQIETGCSDYFHNALRKYPKENFIWEELEKLQALTKDELLLILDTLEEKYIQEYDSFNSGYNLTKGGRGAKDHQYKKVNRYSLNGEYISTHNSVDELKEEFDSVSSIYDCCNGNIKYAYGFIWKYDGYNLSEYDYLTDKEIHEAIVTQRARNKINQYDWYGNLLNEFDNATDASIKSKLPRNCIVNSCSGQNVFGGNYIWRFYDDDFNTHKTTRQKYKPVNQYDLDNNFIYSYISCREAARINNIKYQCIQGVCAKKHNTAGGYKWFYINDPNQPNKSKIIA